MTYANLREIARLRDCDWSNAVSRNLPIPDRWVLSELNMLVRAVTEAMENYDVLGSDAPVADFVDELSNWYVRLSRRRFWDSDR